MNSAVTALDSRWSLVATAGAPAGMVGLAGCSGSATGTLATHVTDRPADIEDLEPSTVIIVGMWLGPEGAASGTEAGDEPADREYHDDEAQEADLVEGHGDATAVVDERDPDTAISEFVQLGIEDTAATLDDGLDATVEMPGDAPLAFDQSFEISEDTRTVFTADLTPVTEGPSGRYVIQPVPQGIDVEDEET